MDFFIYKDPFDEFMGIKTHPNKREVLLIERAIKYVGKISGISGIRMIAIVNSLSMCATHEDSDIDLFIITARKRMWFVRFLVTAIFWTFGVWRHNTDIRGNFCLSFWIEESAIDIEKIAIQNDIYLYFWMYYMKPILLDSNIWDEFQKINTQYRFSPDSLKYATFLYESHTGKFVSKILDGINAVFRYFGEKKSKNNWIKKGKPKGVIIRDDMLKFHDQDKREEIRRNILQEKG